LVTLLGSTSSQFFQGISASSSAKAVTSTTAAAATGKAVTSAAFFKKNDNDKQATATAKSMHSTETDLFSFEEDGALMKDIEYLSSILADIVRTENPHVHELYTRLRKHGLDRANDPNNKSAFEDMKKLAFDISPVDALGVMRIFSLALNLVNCAEVNHKNRNLRRHEMEGHLDGVHVGPLPMIEVGLIINFWGNQEFNSYPYFFVSFIVYRIVQEEPWKLFWLKRVEQRKRFMPTSSNSKLKLC
jgi:hypothetical protein